MKLDNGPYNTGIRFFKSPRPLNIIFSVEDLQGDGIIRLTIGALYRSIQFIYEFDNHRGFTFDWKLIDYK